MRIESTSFIANMTESLPTYQALRLDYGLGRRGKWSEKAGGASELT